MRSAVFVVAHDSQFKWAASMSRALVEQGWYTKFLAPREHTRISEAQMVDVGVEPSEVTHVSELSCIPYISKFDAAFFPTPGGISERIIYRLRDYLETIDDADRPVLITNYVGLIIDNHIAGFLYRSSVDIVCVNSRHDYKLFEATCKEMQIDPSCLVLTGLAIVPDTIIEPKNGPIEKVVFADQIAVPKESAERKLIYQRLVEYAVAHPDRTVIVKPRHRPDEGSFHGGKYPPEQFFKEHHPDNLRIDYTPITDMLPETDLLLTVSSTAALEAIAFGVRVAIISDVAVKEVHGNHMFVGSGLIRSFQQITEDKIGIPDPDWIRNYQHDGEATSKLIINAIHSAIQRRESGEFPLPRSPYFSARRDVLRDNYRFFFNPAKFLQGDPPKNWAFQQRLKTYGPAKRLIVKLGDALIPEPISGPLYRWLKRVGVL